MIITIEHKIDCEKNIKDIIVSKKGTIEDGWVYQNSEEKFSIKCKNDHIWKTNWNRLKKGNWCPECAGQRVHEKDVRSFIEGKGGKLNPDWKYINSKTKFPLICENGHKWITKWDFLYRGNWCPDCAGKYVNPENVKKLIEEKGGVLSPDWAYTKNTDKFKVQCEKGHIWETTWNVIQSNHWCSKCSRQKMDARKIIENKVEEEIQNFIENKGGKLDPDWKYINNHEKFWIQCNKGHRWQAFWNNLKRSNCWCPYCNKHTVDEKFALDFIKNKGGKVSKNWTYTDAKIKFDLECSKGHKFRSCWDKIRASHWCPHCKITKIENEFRKVMENIFLIPFPKQKPEWLINPITQRVLELDGYNQENKIAFEYQGPYHYENNRMPIKMKNIENQKRRDEIKVKICAENKVSLIVMPHWIPKKDWEIEITNQHKIQKEVL